ncbi:hypothetical protein D3C87_1571140 [compost metagenome]
MCGATIVQSDVIYDLGSGVDISTIDHMDAHDAINRIANRDRIATLFRLNLEKIDFVKVRHVALCLGICFRNDHADTSVSICVHLAKVVFIGSHRRQSADSIRRGSMSD